MDRSVHSAPTGQLAVGGIDDGVDDLLSDVALIQLQDTARPRRRA